MKKPNKNTSNGLPRTIRQINLQTVTRRMRQMELFSKVDLARDLGISTTTMTKLFAQLESDGLIEISPVEDKSFGRPKTIYQLSPYLLVCSVVIDIETTTIAFSGLLGDIQEGHTAVFPTGSSQQALFAQIKTGFEDLQKKLNASCRLIGLCIPGLIEAETGQSMLNPNIPWLERSCPGRIIEDALGLPVIVMHEELALGRAQLPLSDDAQNYITLDFSAGVGMSVVTNASHLSGASGYAGEIGHIVMDPNGKLCGCGNRGCLETIASDRVLQHELHLPMHEAIRKLSKGDSNAARIASNIIKAQAKGLASVINIFNPEKVFVYSTLNDTYPNYIDFLTAEAGKLAISLSFKQCKVTPARYGKSKGALLHTIDQLIEQTIR